MLLNSKQNLRSSFYSNSQQYLTKLITICWNIWFLPYFLPLLLLLSPILNYSLYSGFSVISWSCIFNLLSFFFPPAFSSKTLPSVQKTIRLSVHWYIPKLYLHFIILAVHSYIINDLFSIVILIFHGDLIFNKNSAMCWTACSNIFL